jgi:arginyl-tRNA synthetase
MVEFAQQQIAEAIKRAAKQAVQMGELPILPVGDFLLEVPADRQNGDLASNAAMAWARELRMSPRKTAEILANKIDLSDTYANHVEAAGAGFLNFTLSERYYAKVVEDILSKGEAYGESNYGENSRILVEFVSANPTGPMHMGNARGGALGDCLAAVLQRVGFTVEREFYVNDSGNQIEKFGLSLDVRYRQLLGENVELPEDAYHGDDITQRAREFIELYGDSCLRQSEKARRSALVQYALPQNIAAMRQNMKKYRIEYDTWFCESSLYQSGEVERVIALFRDSEYTYESEGALWFKGTEFGCDKDFVLVRSNGLPTYIVPDIAYHYNKLVTRGFDKAINILGADHHGYTIRLAAVLKAIGIDTTKLDIVLIQLVKLMRNGEVVRMSKRTGKSITLEDLLDEIPIDALRFFFNMRDPSSKIDFNLDLAVEESSQNPVYYCQYAHARICSIFNKLAQEGVTPRNCTPEELSRLNAPEERELIRLLSRYTGELIEAAKQYDPARVTRYCMELAGQFHRFYNACRVKTEDEALTQARLALCQCVRATISNILHMFKMTVPEKM